MPSAVSALRSSYHLLENDRRVTTNTGTVNTTRDAVRTTATAAAAAGDDGDGDGDGDGDITCRDVGDIRCSHAMHDSSRDMIKTQVTRSNQ